MMRAPTATPTPMPALAPVVRPLGLPGAVCDGFLGAEVPVLVPAPPVPRPPAVSAVVVAEFDARRMGAEGGTKFGRSLDSQATCILVSAFHDTSIQKRKSHLNRRHQNNVFASQYGLHAIVFHCNRR